MPEHFRRRHLPHWDVPHAAYFITTCLEGSIPAQGLLDLERYERQLERRPPPPDLTAEEWRRYKWKLAFARREDWLDGRPACRHLEDPALAGIVEGALVHFAGTRYDLLGYVIMPSHVHWVFQPLPAWVDQLGPAVQARPPRERVMHSVKLWTARRCNLHLGRRGTFWQQESYDHWVRDVDELERILLYIEHNPVKAGLVGHPADWPFSSTRRRRDLGLELGVPLPGVSVG